MPGYQFWVKLAWQWIRNILVAVDQLANAIFGGDPDETLSSVFGKQEALDRRWVTPIVTVLDWIDPRHCHKSIEDDEGSESVWARYKQLRPDVVELKAKQAKISNLERENKRLSKELKKIAAVVPG